MKYAIMLMMCNGMWAQKPAEGLTNKDYSELINGTSKSDSVEAKKFAVAWIAKSKSEKNWTQLAAAYKAMMYLDDPRFLMKYADSTITVAKYSKNPEIIGSAFLTKGIIHYSQKQLKQALDNYILADKYIASTNNKKVKYKVKFSIAHTKYYLGFYHEAISLFLECLSYFEEESDIAYLNTLHSLGLCYNKTGNVELSSYYNRLGLKNGKELENQEMEPYFNHSEGINHFSRKNYKKAITELQRVLPIMQQRKDFANETVAHFYIGKSYWAIHQEQKAITFFKTVDNAFLKYNYIRPDLRESYELLIDYYKKQEDAELQLKYINRLLKVDSVLNHNYKYLSKKIFKEYDTKKLIAAKQDIENAMMVNNKIHYTVISSLSGAILFLVWRHTRNKKRYKQKFEQIMAEKEKPTKPIQKCTGEIPFDINPELVKTILQNLEKFEKNKRYLEKDMTLIKLSGYLKTNPKYASKIILKYRGKKTIEYITDLKIDYIVEKLKTENKYRNYTYKALAEEAGFGSTQNFTKAFNTRLEMPPAFFIQQLKNSFPL
ncbi:AraC family transcriptional regulator [Flavobacterium sedimenticola]|uniref:AraC family transcriptional regulator n=1 Tax=Flavobacterium sedimenticola TaxID=3043286 RepID=UPI0024B580D9|nr:AraC family transcriptional regulator [Flavobacterium sedimenticola]